MLIVLLGDVHGAFGAVDRAMALEPAAAAWLSVGDIASDSGEYFRPVRPLHFIKGNNEDFDFVARLAAGEQPVPGLRLIPNGRLVNVGGVRVAGLGGTYAPTWYETPPGELPHPVSPRRPEVPTGDSAAGSEADLSRPSGGAANEDLSRRSGGAAKADLSRRSGGAAKAEKRRHFVRAEVEACAALTGVDIFLSHEAPRPYWVGSGRRRNDAGKAVINQAIAAMKPRLHAFGHHHRFSESVCEGVPSIGLPLVSEGYLLVDTDRWAWQFRRLAD